ncbi:MAG: M14 family metallocarboxypeptidase [Chthoniobacterales bacterium]
MPKQTEIAAHLRAHDYAWLVKRWRVLAKREGWRMRKFAQADGFPVYVIESPARSGPSLYLSAGIHGDEPAATEGLITWCEKRARALRKINALIFPCLNPWGLQNNDRHDARGRDLNRGDHRRDIAVIGKQKKILRGRTFDAALMLHEDFDAHGVYLYEIKGDKPFWGEKLLAAAARHLPVEPRKKIEGHAARGGLIRRSVTRDTMPEHPEAFCLRFGHTGRSLTFETPSEFSLTARVRAQGEVLDEVLRLARG